MDFLEQVGKRIEELRRAKRMTQAELADLAGLGRTYLSEVESGKRNISSETMGKIIYALGVHPADFFASEIFGNS